MRSQKGSIFALKRQNKMLLLAGLGSLIATTLVCEVPFLAEAFNLAPVGITEYLIALGLGFTVIPVVEAVKLIIRLIDRAKSKRA
jgi:Ca2+-transporting ATPase